jgi:hypothetical protein
MVRVASQVVLGALLLATPALADPYDFHVAQLGNPVTNLRGDANFRSFARQIGAAITSVNLSPPETLGHSGFAVNAELSVVDFGKGDTPLPTEGTFNGPMLIPSFHVRKGLPWSLELGARAGWIEKSRMGYGSLELKWALNEGFTYLPDIGVKGSVSKLINSRDFDVTAGGLDLGIGKQFAIGGMITLTPYAGWNLVFVGASSGTVDFDPNRPLTQADSPGDQYNSYWVFTSVFAGTNTHNRFYGGFRFIGGVVQLSAEVSYSVIGKFHDTNANEDRNVPPVLAINSTLGLDF